MNYMNILYEWRHEIIGAHASKVISSLQKMSRLKIKVTLLGIPMMLCKCHCLAYYHKLSMTSSKHEYILMSLKKVRTSKCLPVEST